jgi:outer membrane protein assembly factor BamB
VNESMIRTITRISLLIAVLAIAACDTLNDTFFGASEETPLPGQRIAVLQRVSGIEPDPTLAGVAPNLPDAVTNAEWPQAGGVPSHMVGDPALGKSLSKAWSADLGTGEDNEHQILSGPVVAANHVFAMDGEAKVSAFDLASGRRLWQAVLEPKDEDDRYFGGGVAYDNGRVFVTTGFAKVYALNADSGAVIWEAPAAAPMRAAPTVADGRVFAITLENQLLVLSADDGHELWTHSGLTEGTGIIGGASPAVSGPIVIAPYSSGELFAIRVENGRVLWSESMSPVERVSAVSVLADISGRPVIDRDLVFATSHAGRSVAIELRRGGRAWELNAGGTGDPWIAGDTVFLVTKDAQMLAVTRDQGRVRWIQQLARYRNEKEKAGPITWAGPVLAGGLLYVVSSEGQMLALAPTDGKVASTYELPAGSRIAPVVASGTLLVVTRSGDLIAYH